MPDEFAGLPELTLSLRSLGSGRGRVAGGEEQARFFAPLLEARRRAASARSAAEAVAAFNVARLGSALDETVRTLSAERFPSRPPARRAFEAALADAVQPLYAALRSLRDRTPAAQEASDAERWRVWLDSLRATFEAADRVWGAVDVLLAEQPTPSSRRSR
jgi:hypothetical protein